MQSWVPVLAVLTLATRLPAAVPPVDAIHVERHGDDLVLSWTGPATPVDGFRVYRSHQIDCSLPELVYEGAATSYTDTAAMSDNVPSLYRVAAFTGSEESPLTTPAYEFATPGQSGPNWDELVAVPYHVGVLDSRDLCHWANGVEVSEWTDGEDVRQIVRLEPSTNQWTGQSCATTLPSRFQLTPGEALFMAVAAGRAKLWGHGHPTWSIDLTEVRHPSGSELAGYYLVSLPYDHAYPDLAALATDIPNAVDVAWYDPVLDPPWGRFVGLTRPSSTEAWSGDNVDLEPRRGHGVRVAVDVPGSWSPSRLCGRSLPPPAIGSLFLTKAGDDVHLEWAPRAEATGGYRVHATGESRRLLVPAGEAVRMSVSETSPVFPVIDPGVATSSETWYYQVVGVTSDGVRGRF